MRVVLTGATGYLGLHLIQALVASNHTVTAAVRTPSKLGPWRDHPSVDVRQTNLEDAREIESLLGGQEACVHAALIWGAPEGDLELRDVIATAKLFEAAGQAGVRRGLLVSSTAVHRPFRERMTEADALAPTDTYGATKAAGELFLWAACAAHEMAGIVVRSAPIVGPPAFPGGPFRSHSRLEHMVRAARRGEPIEVEEGTGRQFVGAQDVAAVIARLLAADDGNGTWICAAPVVTTWEQIARRIVALTGSRSAVVVVPRASEAPVPRFDVGKIRDRLGLELDSAAALEAHLAHLVGSTTSATWGAGGPIE